MNGLLIKINDIKTSNSFDLTKLVVRIIAVSKEFKLSETELYTIAYFLQNGYTKLSKENLVTDKVFKNHQQVSNLMTSFRKKGILIKTATGEDLHTDFKINTKNIDVIKLEILIKK